MPLHKTKQHARAISHSQYLNVTKAHFSMSELSKNAHFAERRRNSKLTPVLGPNALLISNLESSEPCAVAQFC